MSGKSKKYFSIENFKCQLVTNIRQEEGKHIVEILHPNTKEVLGTKSFAPEEIEKSDPIGFLMKAGADMKSVMEVETSLQVAAPAQTRRTGYKKK